MNEEQLKAKFANLDFRLRSKVPFVFFLENESRAFNFSNKAGLRFGRLVAVEPVGYYLCEGNRRRVAWVCKCDCGKHCVKRGNDLVTKRTHSCGCLKSETTCFFNKRTKSRIQFCTRSSVFQSYKRGAKVRGLAFDLNKDEFFELTQLDCFYCKKPPAMVRMARNGKLGNFIYNGVDRVDSSKGYNKQNCVPCCKVCNKMKFDLPLHDWLQQMHKILSNKKTILSFIEASS